MRYLKLYLLAAAVGLMTMSAWAGDAQPARVVKTGFGVSFSFGPGYRYTPYYNEHYYRHHHYRHHRYYRHHHRYHSNRWHYDRD